MKRETYTGPRQTLKLISKIFSTTILVLLIGVAAFLLYIGVATRLYATKGEKFEPKFSLYTIISPSMKPNLNVYDLIVDVRVDDPKTIKKGDVITFVSTSTVSQGMTITHRVIDIIPAEDGTLQYKTKGDNNMTADGAYVTFENILGKVVFRIPQFGRVQYFLAQKSGWLLVVVVPALFIIIKNIVKLINLVNVKDKAEKASYIPPKDPNKKIREEKRKKAIKNKLKK
ncbi:MAG: signal peptidase I [Bacilli bacterium]|nr:signal peptidase I [Bacilli bacterium]